MAELKAVASFWRKHAEKVGKTFGIGLKVRGQLKKHRADFATQQG